MTERREAPRRPYSDPGGGRVLVYDRIGANKRETWILMVAFVVLIGGLVAAALLALGFGSAEMPGALSIVGVILIVYALLSYRFSTQAVLSISGAHEVTKDEEWEFVRRVENLCIGAGFADAAHSFEDSAPNTFATGITPEKSHVVVTRGLLDKLEPAELEGVLAHELSHIGNYDIRVMTIVTVLVGT